MEAPDHLSTVPNIILILSKFYFIKINTIRRPRAILLCQSVRPSLWRHTCGQRFLFLTLLWVNDETETWKFWSMKIRWHHNQNNFICKPSAICSVMVPLCLLQVRSHRNGKYVIKIDQDDWLKNMISILWMLSHSIWEESFKFFK